MPKQKPSANQPKGSRPRAAGKFKGRHDDLPAGKGDQAGPHTTRPGSGKHGGSKDPDAPHDPPAGR